MSELLAVYGTLMPGQDYEGRPPVEDLLRSRGPCRIPGTLYTEGAYPWLRPGDGVVLGELYEVVDEAALALLDAYESDEYDRVRLRLLEPDVDAWVYVLAGEDRGEPVDDGDWRTWLALRGDR